jgi:hypothetical protein
MTLVNVRASDTLGFSTQIPGTEGSNVKRSSSYQDSLLRAIRQWLPGQFFSRWPVGRRLCWTAQRVFWMSLLMAWSVEQTLGERFDAVRGFLKTVLPHWRLGGSYQGWCDAVQRWLLPLQAAVAQRLRRQMQTLAGRHWQLHGWCAFAVDGSRVECPRTQANEELGCAGRKRTGPQLFVTTLWHVGLGLPWAYRLGPGTASERSHLQDMLPDLPPRSLLLADGGFIGYDLCQRLMAAEQAFVLRVGKNVTLLTQLGYYEREDAQTVYLWPQKQRQCRPLVLRLIVCGSGKDKVYLVTNVLDQEQLSEQAAGVFYQLRWGVEVFYRSCKQTLQRRKMLSRCPASCYGELHGTMLGLWLLGLLSVAAILERGGSPLSWSVALARRLVRQALQGTGRGDLLRQLAGAVKDQYQRRTSKKARDWPHKKNEPPPGPPKVKSANGKQQQQLKRLKEKLTAA